MIPESLLSSHIQIVPPPNFYILHPSSLMQTLKSTSFTDPITNKSYTLGIYYDESPSDPFEDSDCEPPLIYQTYKYSRRDTTHYGTNHIVSELLDLITPRRLTLNRKELLEIIDVDEDYIKENKYKNQTFMDALIDELK